MKILTLFGLVSALTLTIAFQNEEKKFVDLALQDSAPLADTKLPATDNQQYSLKDLKKEKGLLVVFSCNTCPFVVGGKDFAGWEKDYNALHQLALANQLELVLINSNEAQRGDVDSMDEMVKRSKEKAYTPKYLVDKGHLLADAFGARTTPHAFLFDKDLKLVYKGSIDNTYDPKRESDVPYLKNAITHLVKGTTNDQGVTPPRGCSIKRV